MKNKGFYLLLLLTFIIPSLSYAQIYINEIMFDPTPNRGVGINTEYIELYNTTNQPFEAKDLLLKDAKGSSQLPDFTVPKRGYALLIPKNAVLNESIEKEQAQYVIVRVSKWLSLNNDKESLKIENSENILLDSFSFNLGDWKSFKDFKTGGIALEREEVTEDMASVCSLKSFAPSLSKTGGSPARKNIVLSSENYNFQYQINNENVDVFLPNQKIAHILNISMKYYDYHQKTANNIVESHFFSHKIKNNIISIKTNQLPTGYKYKIAMNNITLCNGTIIDNHFLDIVFPQITRKKNQLIVTKVMYNPLSERSEFIEITNPTKYYISLKDISLQRLSADNKIVVNNANFNDKGTFGLYDNQEVDIEVMPPLTSWIMTAHPALLIQQYPALNHHNILVCRSSCLSLPNQGGVIKIIKNQFIIDEVSYNDDYHSAFLKETKGIFLARSSIQNTRLISGTGIGLDNPEHSFINTQENNHNSKDIEVSPKVLDLSKAPDSQLTIQLPSVNNLMLVTIVICNKRGYPLVTLAENETASDRNTWHFNPYKESNIAWQSGRYIVVIKLILSKSGYEQLYKDTFILYFN